MKYRLLSTAVMAILAGCNAMAANALTMQQFSKACAAYSGDCRDHPHLQAYVGGALDLMATLDEKTDYLSTVYCAEPQTLFKVPKIIDYMQKHAEQYSSDNAMLVLVRYFEELGGCEQ